MKIIDFHTHVILNQNLRPSLAQSLESNNPWYFARIENFKNPQKTVEFYKQQGVKYAVVLAEHAPATSDNLPTEDVLEFCRGQEMLIPFASINPYTDHEPERLLEKYVKDGARGLKLLPSYQFFYLNEAKMYPIYAKAQQLRIPVLVHIGSSAIAGTRLKYCDPIQLDDIAVDFPNLTIIMAHSGRGLWYDKCFFLSKFHENVFMEISGLPPQKLLTYFPDLEKNADKIIFGSDWPIIPTSISENIKQIEALPISDMAIESILYKNAEGILFR